MRDSRFGWSLPAGVTHIPGEDCGEWDTNARYKCSHCGSFLSNTPNRSEGHDDIRHCNGKPLDENPNEPDVLSACMCACGKWENHEPHDFCEYSWTEFIRVCKRCGHENKEID